MQATALHGQQEATLYCGAAICLGLSWLRCLLLLQLDAVLCKSLQIGCLSVPEAGALQRCICQHYGRLKAACMHALLSLCAKRDCMLQLEKTCNCEMEQESGT